MFTVSSGNWVVLLQEKPQFNFPRWEFLALRVLEGILCTWQGWTGRFGKEETTKKKSHKCVIQRQTLMISHPIFWVSLVMTCGFWRWWECSGETCDSQEKWHSSTHNFGNLVKNVPISCWLQVFWQSRSDTFSAAGGFCHLFHMDSVAVFLAFLPISWDSLISSIEKMFFWQLMETALHKQNKHEKIPTSHKKMLYIERLSSYLWRLVFLKC